MQKEEVGELNKLASVTIKYWIKVDKLCELIKGNQ